MSLDGSDSDTVNEEVKFKQLVKQRGSIRGRLTLFENYLDELMKINVKDLTGTQFTELNLRVDKLEALFAEFETCQTKCEMYCPVVDEQLKERELTETKFYLNISTARSFMKKIPQSVEGRRDSSVCSHKDNLNVKLPIIKLPSFDGNYFMWLEFRDTFESLIHNNGTIPDINKFHYLRSSLEGSAALVIKSIEFTSQNYEVAWDLLCQRYNNKKILINNHLKALFKIETVAKESHRSIRYLIDIVTKNLRALETLGQPVDQWDTLIIYLVSTKLDTVTSSKWEEYRNTLNDLPQLSEFIKFLRDRADILETTQANRSERSVLHSSKDSPIKNECKNSFTNHKFAKTFVTSGSPKQTGNWSCPLCSQAHRIIDCETFKSFTVDKKLSEVAKLKLCINCLRRGHEAGTCRLGACRLCNSKHNTMLHKNNIVNNTHSEASSSSVAQNNQDRIVLPKTLSVQSCGQVLLGTALVKVMNPVNKNTYVARVLLDAGSQSSFMTENLKHKIGLVNRNSGSLFISGINNIKVPISDRCNVNISSLSNEFRATLHCLIVPQITGPLPNMSVDTTKLNLPNYIELADPQFCQPAEVDMLLGAEIFYDIICPERIPLGKNMPILQSTQFGWIVAGPLNMNTSKSAQPLQCYFTKEISDKLTQFWNLEELPLSNLPVSADDEFCEEHYIKNTYRLPSGRFSVSMPLREEPETSLGDSYKMAAKCFYNLEKKLNKQPKLKQQYHDFIHEYETLGHLTKVNKPDFGSYFPHHPVIRESSETTKLRVVFNASAKTKSSKSLNDIQYVGPVVQDDLFNILVRFRQHKYVFTGDIQKCYRQILINIEQRHLQMILWRDDESQPLQTLQLNTLTYGTASAPYLSTRCLLQLALECTDPLISEVIKKDCYMDDLLTGADSEDTLAHIRKNVIKVFDSGCFPLHKFRSNCPQIFSDCASSESLDLSKQSSVLGVHWAPDSDTFTFGINLEQGEDKISKRKILSNTCKIFDPLGLISACTITLKILLQKLWQLKLSWDEEVPNHIKKTWTKLTSNLNTLLSLSVPRYVLCQSPVTCELHCFVDASQEAYAACVYTRTTNECNCVTVKLLCAKTRVAPLKAITIPRLELCAALLGARLVSKVSQALRCSVDKKTFWSDSTITLGWIKTQPKLLKTFVCNRINDIHELTSRNSWRHIPTDINPADMASRGVDPTYLVNSSLWWEGPTFLKLDESEWPQSPNTNVTLPEIKTLLTNINTETVQPININIENYSSASKLKRIFAYVYRFIHNCQNKNIKSNGPLKENEIKQSLSYLVKVAQSESFAKEINLIKSNKRLTSTNLLQLSPYISDGVLRVGGRLNNTNFDFEKKHPALLSGKHHLTKLLMRAEHLRLLHAGPQLLLSSFRDQFWPIGGRTLARRIVRQCVTCTRFRAKAMEPLMGQLPSSRVTQNYPFQICGADFAGPFQISSRIGRGNRISKCYLCLFVCFCTKAVHLEVVSDLSTNAFISCLRRFISRRGKPSQLSCDNATNFVGASNELSRVLQAGIDSIYNFSVEEGIKFSFIPPYSPTFGGLWESNIKGAKFHIKRVIGNTSLTFEELSTLCAQVEAVLNSRPLTPLSSNPSDLSPLTPGHFLIGRPLAALPSPPAAAERSIKTRYQLIQALKEGFWKRWHMEYLSELQKRTKWRSPYKALKEGSMVIFKEENLPPMKWKLGRVHRLYPGKDGVSRVADFTTIRGIERRALNKVCPLLDEDESLEAASALAVPVVAERGSSASSNGPPGCLRQ